MIIILLNPAQLFAFYDYFNLILRTPGMESLMFGVGFQSFQNYTNSNNLKKQNDLVKVLESTKFTVR